MELRDLDDFDLGPEEHQLALDEAELNSEQQRKIKQLQSEKLGLQAEVESLTRRVCALCSNHISHDKISQHACRRNFKSLVIFFLFGRIQIFLISTVHFLRSTREGDVFTGVCDIVYRGGWRPGPCRLEGPGPRCLVMLMRGCLVFWKLQY